MAGVDDAVLVAAGQEDQRAVGGGDVVEEHRDVHRPRLGHVVVARPGAVVLVPLPDVAVERGLGVDLVLVHVDRPAEDLHHRLDQPRMAAEAAKGFVVGVRGEGGARDAGLFAPDLVALERVNLGRGPFQHAHLVGVERVRQEQVAAALEFVELRVTQLHAIWPRWSRSLFYPRSPPQKNNSPEQRLSKRGRLG